MDLSFWGHHSPLCGRSGSLFWMENRAHSSPRSRLQGETTKEKGVFQSHEPGNQSTSTWSGTIEGKTANLLLAHTGGTSAADQMNQTFKSFPASSELLSDVPFTLSPHILAIHASFQDLPAGLLLPNNMSENLASFGYDFTLENSVLRNS
ncbi:UBAP1-MVB12-associated (UMA)-domain containing protein 1 isoform X5 [Narcine bancroftii]|uniref:UBAP1-MVB12-associated (UMA)-domain containing protein 1 isoform X5 n=1 Tax=Narcine bancroftii TaxID=1343680 RepID=UPI003831781C